MLTVHGAPSKMRIVFQLLLGCFAFVNRVASQPPGLPALLEDIASKIDVVNVNIENLDTKVCTDTKIESLEMKIDNLETEIEELSTTVNTLQNQVYSQVHYFHKKSMKIEISIPSFVSNTALLLEIEGSPWIADVCFSVVPSSSELQDSETVASNLVEVSKLSVKCDFSSRVAQHEVKLVESRYDGGEFTFDEGADTSACFRIAGDGNANEFLYVAVQDHDLTPSPSSGIIPRAPAVSSITVLTTQAGGVTEIDLADCV